MQRTVLLYIVAAGLRHDTVVLDRIGRLAVRMAQSHRFQHLTDHGKSFEICFYLGRFLTAVDKEQYKLLLFLVVYDYLIHDRYFINRTAHRILDLTEGQFVSYVGNYDYYLEKHDTVMAAIEASAPQNTDADNTAAAKAAESEVKLDWKAQKEEQARLRKKENDLKKCEEKIAELEARISEIDTEMSDPAIGTQVAKLQELSKEQAACQEQLEKLYEQWEELAE